MAARATEASFWSKVDQTGDCWPWTRAVNVHGYGIVGWQGNFYLSHRLAFELATGTKPEQMMVCHRCDSPPCCNPDHLFLGTQLDNMRDCVAKGRLRSNVGVCHPGAKLTEDDVREIRRRKANGARSADVATEFGIDRTHVWQIASGRRWSHVV
jgi:uncharacterized NAD-dependent epimerase/dehydratase family protein